MKISLISFCFLILSFLSAGISATNNAPANTTTVTLDPDNVTLSWTPGSIDGWPDLSFKILLGTDATPDGSEQQAWMTNAVTQLEFSDLEPNTIYYWKINGLNGKPKPDPAPSGYNVNYGPTWSFKTSGINPEKASVLYPGQGQTLAAETGNPNQRNNVLQWSPGNTTVSYNVYFGKDQTPDDEEFRGNQTSPSYSPGILEPNTRYYWRINPVRADGTALAGRLWTFWNGAAPAGGYSQSDTTLFGEEFNNGAVNQPIPTDSPESPLPYAWTRPNTSAQTRNSSQTGRYARLGGVTSIEKKISTKGFRNIRLRYYRATPPDGHLLVRWSPNDGVTWNTLEDRSGSSSFADGLQEKSCGAGASHKPKFRIRFETTGSSSYANVDGIQLVGRAEHIPWDPNGGHHIGNSTVIFLGDSLTSNTGSLTLPDDGYEHWTTVLKNRFNLTVRDPNGHDSGNTSIPHNHGAGGSRAYEGNNPIPNSGNLCLKYGTLDALEDGGGYQRLKYAFDVDHMTADFVFICFGMNDHKRKWSSSNPPVGLELRTVAAFQAHLEAIIALVREKGAHPILITPSDFYPGEVEDVESYSHDFAPAMYGADQGGALGRYGLFMKDIKDAAAAANAGRPAADHVDVVDVNAASKEYDAEEFTVNGGVHLDELGHKVWGQIIGDYLAERYP